MQLDTIVKGGTVVTPGGTFVGDVGIAGEKISARMKPGTTGRIASTSAATAFMLMPFR